MTSADVLVVGAGPAGSALATLLSRGGWDVVIVDRAVFPRAKPCGEFVNPGALRLLRRLGLDGALPDDAAPVRGWTLRSSGRREARGRYGDGHHGYGVRRLDLDAALLAGARAAGTRTLEGIRVTDVDPGGDGEPAGVELRAPGGRTRRAEARIVVGADGLRSTLARRLDLVARRPRLRKLSLTCHLAGRRGGEASTGGVLHLASGMTFGVAPLRRDGTLWNGTLVVDADRHGRRVAADAERFYREAATGPGGPWEGGPPEVVGGPWASGPFDFPTRRAWRGRVALVGDAAGYYDPLTGQGIHRALLSAELAARSTEAILAGDALPSRALPSYDRALRRRLGGTRRVQRLVETVVSRSALREPALAMLGRTPATAGRLLRVTGDLRPARSLASARTLVSLVGEVAR